MRKRSHHQQDGHGIAARLSRASSIKILRWAVARRVRTPGRARVKTWAYTVQLGSKVEQAQTVAYDDDADGADGRFLRLTPAQERDILKELRLTGDDERRAVIAAVLPIMGTYERDRLLELNAPHGQDELRGASIAISALRAAIQTLGNLGPNAAAAINSSYVGGDFTDQVLPTLRDLDQALVDFIAKKPPKPGAPGYPALENAVARLADVFARFREPKLGGPFIRFCRTTLHLLDPDLEDLSAVEGMVKKVLGKKRARERTS